MWRVVAVAGLVAALGALVSVTPGERPARAAGSVVVTSTGDAGGDGLCPHESNCTLRAAIQAANADESGGAFSITFDPAVFDPDDPETIEIGLAPLPALSRPGSILDGSGAGVRIRNNDPSLSGSNGGLHIAAAGVTVVGLDVAGFPAACILVAGPQAVVGGSQDLGLGNRLAACGTGIAIYAPGATILGNELRALAAGDAEGGFTLAIEVAASNASIGPAVNNPDLGNVIGDAGVGISVVGNEGAPVAGTAIRYNWIGRTPGGVAVPVGTAVELRPWSSNTSVRQNVVANAVSGIAVSPPGGAPPPAGNGFFANTFAAIGGAAISVPAGVAPGPATITRATQSRIEGLACPNCSVQVYTALHLPGGVDDYGTTPLAGGTVTTDAEGTFALDNPATSAGEWVTTLVTDPAGTTGAFGPSARVGAGAVQCGSSQLRPGWNHVAYFGPQVVFLGETFAADPAGRITAIYRMVDGTMNYQRWFRSREATPTLALVQPGESYWMFATDAVTLAGGFSVSFPIPVELAAGWNDFVYVGAAADVADALAPIQGKYRDLHSFDAESGRFLRYGDSSIPSWAREFTLMTPCTTYQVFMFEAATLTPLQP